MFLEIFSIVMKSITAVVIVSIVVLPIVGTLHNIMKGVQEVSVTIRATNKALRDLEAKLGIKDDNAMYLKGIGQEVLKIRKQLEEYKED